MFKTAGAGEFFAAWRKLLTDTSIPHYRTAFEKLPPNIIPFIMVFERATEDNFVIRFMGTACVELWGRDLTGHNGLAVVPPARLVAARRNMQSVLDHPCGVRHVGLFTMPSGRQIEVENVILPTANDPGRPLRILSFSQEHGPVGYTDTTQSKIEGLDRGWIDVGFGVPRYSPANT